MFDPSIAGASSEWDKHLGNLRTGQIKNKHLSSANRRAQISTEILKKALGSHAVNNAFFSIDFASEYGSFGHTMADIMHCFGGRHHKILGFYITGTPFCHCTC
jgi:hypothetical protein